MDLIGNYSSGSSGGEEEQEEVQEEAAVARRAQKEGEAKDETKRPAGRRLVQVNALRRLGGKVGYSAEELRKDGEEEEQQAVSRAPRAAGSASLKSFLPAPKHAKDEPPEKPAASGTSKRPTRRIDPFSAPLKRKKAQEEVVPVAHQEEPAVDDAVGAQYEPADADAPCREDLLTDSQPQAPPDASRSLPDSVLRDLERDGIQPDEAVIEVHQAQQLGPRHAQAEDDVRTQEQNYKRVRLATAAAGPAGAPTKTQKRKSQINFLAADLASKQLELEERRTRGQRTKKETWAKYGW
mmetsp:Transcript_1744/g.5280  ORF Transcript_1744/g.5280 Transcript_1744/m.5280 type:complete len:295 (-) Transcript_1744:1893-2777(-)